MKLKDILHNEVAGHGLGRISGTRKELTELRDKLTVLLKWSEGESRACFQGVEAENGGVTIVKEADS